MKKSIESSKLISEFFNSFNQSELDHKVSKEELTNILNGVFKYLKVGFYDNRYPEITITKLGTFYPKSTCEANLKSMMRIPEFYDLYMEENLSMIENHLSDPLSNSLDSNIIYKYCNDKAIEHLTNMKTLQDKRKKEAQEFYNNYISSHSLSNDTSQSN